MERKGTLSISLTIGQASVLFSVDGLPTFCGFSAEIFAHSVRARTLSQIVSVKEICLKSMQGQCRVVKILRIFHDLLYGTGADVA